MIQPRNPTSVLMPQREKELFREAISRVDTAIRKAFEGVEEMIIFMGVS